MKQILSLLLTLLSFFTLINASSQPLQVRQNGNEYQFWTHLPETEQQFLTATVTVDENGLPSTCQTIDYDDLGRLTSTTIYGNLSGNSNIPLTIGEDGRPLDKSIDHYSMYWTYSPEDPSLVATVIEDNGTTIMYQYDPETKKIAAELTTDGTTLYKRRFLSYNESGQPVTQIIDNGSSYDPESTADVTMRYITTFTYCTDGAACGLLEEIEENRLSLSSGSLYCIKRITNLYDTEGKLIDQKISTGPKSEINKYKTPAANKSASFSSYFSDKWENLMIGIFGKGFLQFSGYYQDTASSGIFNPDNEINDKVRITLINGILNVSSDMESILHKISRTHGNISIHYVFRPTEGWSRDILNCTFIKFGYKSTQAHLLAEQWRKLIKEMGGVGNGGQILHYAHSIGATDTYSAKDLLTPEELQMIHVITLGSPSMIPPSVGFAGVANYVSKRDLVCMLDPIGYIKGMTNYQDNIYFLGSPFGMIEHTLNHESYNNLLQDLGENFVTKYKQP